MIKAPPPPEATIPAPPPKQVMYNGAWYTLHEVTDPPAPPTGLTNVSLPKPQATSPAIELMAAFFIESEAVDVWIDPPAIPRKGDFVTVDDNPSMRVTRVLWTSKRRVEITLKMA